MAVSPDGVTHSELQDPPHPALPAPHTQKALPAPANPSRGGLWRKIGLLVLLLLAAVFAYLRIKSNQTATVVEEQKAAAAQNRPTPVTVSPVLSRTMPIYYTALGTVEAYNSVIIKTRVDGQLLSVNVREGQQVKQGQVIAMIDPRPYVAAVAQAEGQLLKDQAAARNNEAEANRYKALYEAGVVSKESEQAQVSNSGQSVGTMDADRAAIQAAKVNVAYTRITSPINGVVGLRQTDPGNIVHAADATGLLLITQLQPISVIFTLPEDQVPQVLKLMRAGAKLAVDAYDRSQTTHLATGTLLTVDNQIDPTTGTLKGKAVFNNVDGALFPNQFVNVRVVLEQRQNSLLVPASAIQTGSNGNFVYVVRQGNPPQQPAGSDGSATSTSKAKGAKAPATQGGAGGDGTQKPAGPQYYVAVQNVVVDLTEGAQVILKSGVKPGDQVVVDGQEKLKPFSRVIPKQGKSNGGGPSTQAIGAQGTTTPAPDATAPTSSTPDRNQPNGQPSGQTGSRP